MWGVRGLRLLASLPAALTKRRQQTAERRTHERQRSPPLASAGTRTGHRALCSRNTHAQRITGNSRVSGHGQDRRQGGGNRLRRTSTPNPTPRSRTPWRSSRSGATRRSPPLGDVDEADTAEGLELPGVDLSGEELSRVVPKRPTSSPARPASSSTTDTATPANAQAYRSAATALPDLGSSHQSDPQGRNRREAPQLLCRSLTGCSRACQSQHRSTVYPSPAHEEPVTRGSVCCSFPAGPAGRRGQRHRDSRSGRPPKRLRLER